MENDRFQPKPLDKASNRLTGVFNSMHTRSRDICVSNPTGPEQASAAVDSNSFAMASLLKIRDNSSRL